MLTRQLSFLMGARNDGEVEHNYARGYDIAANGEVTLMA